MPKNTTIRKLTSAGVIAALSFVAFTFLKIPMPGNMSAVHLGNAVVVLGAFLIGGFYGGLGGALGMVIADLMDANFIIYAPTTFILKLGIGLISGFIAHRIGKINQQSDQKKLFKWVLLAAMGGLIFNFIFSPLVNYFYNLLILGKPAAELRLAYNIVASSINAVASTAVSVSIYLALRPALKKSGFFDGF
ncbi:MAG: ECF transporter S component [Lachnospiraceae bacterium]|nr:ECF transporter S component [Lachnospiraceae bacterium]